MGLSASTNLGALAAKRYLEINTLGTTQAEEQLASGMRASNPAYDPSSSAVGFSLGATVNTLNQTSRNVSQAQAMIQMASGVLGSTQTILTRMKTLTAQSNSDTIGSNQRTMIDNEYQQLMAQININANTARWGGTSLLGGTGGTATGLTTSAYSATGLTSITNAFNNTFTTTNQSGFISGAATSASVVDVGGNYQVSVVIGGQSFTGISSPANNGILKLDSVIDAGSYISFNYAASVAAITNAATFQTSLQTFLGINTSAAPATFTSLATTNAGMPNTTFTSGSGTASGVWAMRYAIGPNNTGKFIVSNGTEAYTAPVTNTTASMTTIVNFSNGTSVVLNNFNGTTAKAQEQYTVSAGTGVIANIQYGEKATDTMALAFTPLSATALNLNGTSLTTLGNAQATSLAIDNAAGIVNNAIAQLGGKYSQLTQMSDTLKIAIQNQTAAESTFVDANPAEALSDFMKYKGLAEVASTVLTQALNQQATLTQMVKNIQ